VLEGKAKPLVAELFATPKFYFEAALEVKEMVQAWLRRERVMKVGVEGV
jgi:hypothetical protein